MSRKKMLVIETSYQAMFITLAALRDMRGEATTEKFYSYLEDHLFTMNEQTKYWVRFAISVLRRDGYLHEINGDRGYYRLTNKGWNAPIPGDAEITAIESRRNGTADEE